MERSETKNLLGGHKILRSSRLRLDSLRMTVCAKRVARGSKAVCHPDSAQGGRRISPRLYYEMRQYYVYILTNRKQGVLYTGVTNNLERRIYEHKNKLISDFTSKYNLTILVYFEATIDVSAAIAREKQIKGWLRKKKIALIESQNPDWKDLSEKWFSTA